MIFFLLASLCYSKAETQKDCATAEIEKEISSRTEFKRYDQIKIVANITLEEPSNEPGDLPNETVTNNIFTRWYPKVDKLGMLEINDPKCRILNAAESSIRLYVKDNETIDIPYRYPADPSSDEYKYVVDFYSVLVFFDKGKVTSVAWDYSFDTNSCKVRDLNKFKYTCGREHPRQSANCTNKIKIFLGFVGRDVDNTPMVAGSTMPSTFLKFGMGGIIDDSVALFNKAKDFFTSL